VPRWNKRDGDLEDGALVPDPTVVAVVVGALIGAAIALLARTRVADSRVPGGTMLPPPEGSPSSGPSTHTSANSDADGRLHVPAALRGTLGIIGAIATSVGVLGFLVFVGGAVQLARDRGAGTAGVSAVSLVPRDQLLISGADQLFSPFLVTLVVLSLGALYIVAATKWDVPDKLGLALLALAGVFGVGFFERNTGYPGPFNTEDFGTTRDMTVAILLVAIPLAWHFIKLVSNETTRAQGPIAGLLAVLGVATIAVGSLYTIALNEWNPPSQPIALVRHSGLAVAGIYLGEDSDHLYVGVVAHYLNQTGPYSQTSTRIVTVDRSDIVGVEKGANSIRIGGLRNKAKRDPTPLTAVEAGMLEDLLLPSPPTPKVLEATLKNVPLSVDGLQGYYDSNIGLAQTQAQRGCVRSAFEPPGTEREVVNKKLQALSKKQNKSNAQVGFGQRTATFADFLYLLARANVTAGQMLAQLEAACAVQLHPAFSS
jgi:hypothetical protein